MGTSRKIKIQDKGAIGRENLPPSINPSFVSIYKGLSHFLCSDIYSNGKTRKIRPHWTVFKCNNPFKISMFDLSVKSIYDRKNPPKQFLKRNYAHAMRKIPFCDKDAIGEMKKYYIKTVLKSQFSLILSHL